MSEEDNVGNVEVNVEVEKNARHFGWVSKEEFRGNEADWVDAETFEKRGKEINPILRANNDRLKKELEVTRDKHDKEIAELRAATEEFKTFQKESYERKQKQLQDELLSLKDQRKEAIREGDADLVVEIEDRIEEVKDARSSQKEPVAIPRVEEPVKLDPSLSNWIEDNTWFGNDIEATEVVNGLGASIRRQFPGLKGKEFLDKLDERIESVLPQLRGNPNQERASVDSSTTRGSSTTKKKSYDNLPSDAKAACDKFVKQGLFKTKQEYVDSYDWS